ncbi:MAG TPA: nodulation protein NfeD [Nitrososphaerales archaeon]|nr:nodulation protein NfeD [Nitrososphaerales archaeon]
MRTLVIGRSAFLIHKGKLRRSLLSLAGLVLAVFLIVVPIYFSTTNQQNNVLVSVAQGSSTNQVVVIQLYEAIDAGSAAMISRGISLAQSAQSAAVIIDMNTPGGLLSDMITMIDAIQNSSVPVYTFVGNDSNAASAGSYVAMATNKIYMAPGSQIGPSTPFVVGGSASEQQHVQNYALSLMESLATEHNRNVTAAGIMVENNTAYTYAQAIQLHVVDGLSTSLQGTLTILNLAGATIVTVSENLSEQAVSFLSNSTVDGILLILGVIAIVLDLLHPTILLSIAGAVMIILALIGAEAIQGPSPTLLVPLVLFAVAAVLIVFELKTGHGFMLFAGVVVGAFATVLLTYGIEYSPSPLGGVEYAELAILILVGGFIAIYARWIGHGLRKKPVTGQESLVGKLAEVYSDLNPEGDVSLDGIIWRAKLLDPSSGNIPKGRMVVVKSVSGLALVVEPQAIKEKQASDAEGR